jgi:uncharacterized membrane protein YraQ (UPF0718 family)
LISSGKELVRSLREFEKYFDIIGLPLIFIFGLVLLTWQLKKQVPAFDPWLEGVAEKLRLKPGITAKRVLVFLLSVLAMAAYCYCYFCGKSPGQKGTHDASFFHVMVSFTLRVYPYFIVGCVLSGLIEKVFKKNSNWLPSNMIGAGIFASLLPICSCAAVPFSYSLMATKRIRLSGIITFMMVVPVLNPFVIVFAQGVLGWQYVIYRILAIFVLAMITGTLVEYFLGEREPDAEPGSACFSCKGCGAGGAIMNNTGSFIEASYNLMVFLTPYMIIGIIIGALFTVFIPPYVVGKYLSSEFTGMLLAVLIGLPVFLCSGEDVLILSPLIEMGLPMGHAIALTIAGNGICLSSIALLTPLFGRKATVWIVLSFFFGSILLGMAINQLDIFFSC